MTNFLFGIVIFLIFCVGIIIGTVNTAKMYHARCVEANPTISVGDIDAFCKERLYTK